MKPLLTIFMLLLISGLQAQIICTEIPDGVQVTEEAVAQYCPEKVYVPQVFTPNGDDINDIFRVVGNTIFNEFELQITNRWGQVIYRSQLPKQGWDGHVAGGEAAEGDYYWMISYTRNTGQREQAAGRVLLLR